MCHEVQKTVSGLPKLGLQIRGSHLTAMHENKYFNHLAFFFFFKLLFFSFHIAFNHHVSSQFGVFILLLRFFDKMLWSQLRKRKSQQCV